MGMIADWFLSCVSQGVLVAIAVVHTDKQTQDINKKKKANAKEAAKEKPAAAVKKEKTTVETEKAPVAKRPAAKGGGDAPVAMDDVFEKLKAVVKKKPRLARGTFTSRAYDTALRRMVRHGESSVGSAELARDQYRKAAELHAQL